MPNDNVLTARVADLLHLLEFATIHTPTEGDGPQIIDAIRDIKAFLAAHPGQPVADDAAVRGDERAKRKAFTAVFLGVTTDEAREIVNHPKWSAGSWSHALDDRDAARAQGGEKS
nr:hypothetical protein [Burkholderia multivorans]